LYFRNRWSATLIRWFPISAFYVRLGLLDNDCPRAGLETPIKPMIQGDVPRRRRSIATGGIDQTKPQVTPHKVVRTTITRSDLYHRLPMKHSVQRLFDHILEDHIPYTLARQNRPDLAYQSHNRLVVISPNGPHMARSHRHVFACECRVFVSRRC
jgi:hypothetical protein